MLAPDAVINLNVCCFASFLVYVRLEQSCMYLVESAVCLVNRSPSRVDASSPWQPRRPLKGGV